MPIRREKSQVDRMTVLKKGTLTLLTTLGAGVLFGESNMMLAFVLILGMSSLERRNLRIKTLDKLLVLIGVYFLLVTMAFIASLNPWYAIPINLATLFSIIYLTVSPYNQTTYKNLMMLYVFCQYIYIPLNELPWRYLMIIFTAIIMVGYVLLMQMKRSAVLDDTIGEAFALIHEQLREIEQGRYSSELSLACGEAMNKLAYVIYISSYNNRLTTYVGKIQFHFYLNISYLNFLMEQLFKNYTKKIFSKKQMDELVEITGYINEYFERKISRQSLMGKLDSYIVYHQNNIGFEEEMVDIIYDLRKNFKELDELNYKDRNKPYEDWRYSDFRRLYERFTKYFSFNSIGVNFAIRMSVVLTIALFLASMLGYYKFIWAIIPIMSITQPYYEDTQKRKWERLNSNVVASITIAILLSALDIRWFTLLVLIIGFYGLYAYKDYYHMSLFTTVISMCLSSFGKSIQALLFYRIIYVLVGVTIVELVSRLFPYKLKDGIKELIGEGEKLNTLLEAQSIASLEGKADLNIIRHSVIYSALICQKLSTKNAQYQSDKIRYIINTNTEFVIRLGHKLLRD